MKWSCSGCGACCRFFDIEIDEDDISLLETLSYNRDEFTEQKKGKTRIKKDGINCVFLEKDNKCKIHIKHGYDKKPKVCRGFPTKKGINQMYCGTFSDFDDIAELPVRNDYFFEISRRKISHLVLMKAINTLGKDDYLEKWNKIYTAISKLKKKEASEADIDSILKIDENFPIRNFIMRMQLGLYSKSVASYWANIYLKKPVDIEFHTGKIRFHPDASKKVKMNTDDVDKLLGLLKKGYGIVFESEFPLSLLFTLYYLLDFAASIAIEDGRKETDFNDILSAFVLLNSTAKFPRVITPDYA